MSGLTALTILNFLYACWLIAKTVELRSRERRSLEAREQLRRVLVLASYAYNMEHFDKYAHEPGFLSVEWLESYYSAPLPDYVVLELDGASA